MFSLEHDGDEQDYTLANIYMNRPDLVRNTERQLELVGPVINPYQESVTPETELVQKVVKKTENADIEAPVDIFVAKPNFWKFSGNYSLQLFQNYVSDNWYKGGESNYSMLGTVTLQANYNNKQRFRWENKLEMRLGLQNSKGDTLHTVRSSEDLIRYTGKVGLQATKRWYYTLQLIASTQFMRSLKSNDRTVYSDFLSPLYINPSLGMDYTVNAFKNRLTGSIHLAPIAYNLTYVKDSKLASRFGVEEGKHTKYDFGGDVRPRMEDCRQYLVEDASLRLYLVQACAGGVGEYRDIHLQQIHIEQRVYLSALRRRSKARQAWLHADEGVHFARLQLWFLSSLERFVFEEYQAIG